MNNLPKNLKMGLEIHLRLNTDKKLFSDAKNSTLGEANTRIALYDLAIPGTMPILNKNCLFLALSMAKRLKFEVSCCLVFDRKHYSYPDLPSGYQLTQNSFPLGKNGYCKIIESGETKTVTFKQIHLETDAAKLNKEDSEEEGIDYNRCGVPLIEIVTDPCIYSPDELTELIEKVRRIAIIYGISTADMSKGDMRCDVNISWEGIRRQEIKNINSINFARKAVLKIIKWQNIEDLKNGSWTWWYNGEKDILSRARSKESESDYMYMREHDMKPYHIPKSFLKAVYRYNNFRKNIYSKVSRVISDENVILKIMNTQENELLREIDKNVLYSDLDINISYLNIIKFIGASDERVDQNKLNTIRNAKVRLTDRQIRDYVVNDIPLNFNEKNDDFDQALNFLKLNWNKDYLDFYNGNDRALNYLLGRLASANFDAKKLREPLLLDQKKWIEEKRKRNINLKNKNDN